MISVAAAKKIIADNLLSLPVTKLGLQDAAQLRLAENIYSPVDVPAFPQSSMDGYAFAYASYQPGKKFTLHGEMQAGSKETFMVGADQAARIFTGAPLPANTDTVIMQEKVTVAGSEITIHGEDLQPGTSVRTTGSAIKAGELALPKNSLLTPGAIGFLAGIGINDVPVFARPAISIVVTGNELQQPGTGLAFGEVYESNSFALTAALNKLQVTIIKVYNVADELEQVKQVMNAALAGSDMVLVTGGVSVGDYDFVVDAAAACGITKLFHKIKQRPGKPLYFGKIADKLFFGLPGNPSSVLSCFYEYVLPALQVDLTVLHAPLAKSVQKSAGLTHFLKGWYNGNTVMPLDAQESYRMSSFAVANCLIKLDEETTVWWGGELAEIHLLSF